MGRLIPLADYVHPTTGSPWFAPRADPGDWDPCAGCLIRSACREVRECHDTPATTTTDPEPDIVLRLVARPDIVA
jgi:hypothetical protein